MTGSREMVSIAAAAFLFVSHPTSADQSSLVLPQISGPFDPEDQKRQPERPKSELTPYIRTPEEQVQELKNGLAGIILVGGFLGVTMAIRRFRGY